MLLRRLLQENGQLLREVEELRALRETAYQDSLTGLGNRRYLDVRLEEEMVRGRRQPSRTGTLLVIDVKGFKSINERHGRVVGDRALRWLGKILQDSLRRTDICCRTGGDELAVILPGSDRSAAEEVVLRVRARLNGASGHRWLPLSVSTGLATWPSDALDIQDLVEHAQRALSDDKRRRRPQPPRLWLVP
jgi:diguanylate cyclase (GGDEF)-like protein